MIIIATILSGLSLLKSILFILHLRSPYGWMVWFPKLNTEGLSPYWAIMGAIGALIGWKYQALWAVPMGIFGAGTMIWYIWRCTRDHNCFDKAFGADWTDQDFDLLLPQLSPPAQSALYGVDRFLALMLKKG